MGAGYTFTEFNLEMVRPMKNENVLRFAALSRACARVAVCMFALTLAFAASICAAEDENAHPTLAIGSPAPGFSLPGIDGKTHTWPSTKPPTCW